MNFKDHVLQLKIPDCSTRWLVSANGTYLSPVWSGGSIKPLQCVARIRNYNAKSIAIEKIFMYINLYHIDSK